MGMRLFLTRHGGGLVRLAQVSALVGVAAIIAGCGNNYRPVIIPVNASGPAAQPTAYLVVISQPSPTTAGEATIVDYSGDTIMAEVPIGLAPASFALDASGSNAYSLNSDGTITGIPVSTSVQQKQLTISTLPNGAKPLTMFATSFYLLVTDFTNNVVDIFAGSPESFRLSIPVATSPVFTTGNATGTTGRLYTTSQGFADATGLVCTKAPRTATATGATTPIELSNFTADPQIAVGKCPVYGVQTPSQQRLFVLNRGDDTITVINSQINALDSCAPFVNQNGQTVNCHPKLPLSLSAVTATGVTPPNGTAGMTNIAGPVYAEYNQATSQLVVADFDGGTISLIDCSLDEFGNDSSTFGTTYTIAVGNNPASVTALYVGTRSYTANQTDGTVTIVNLSSHTVEKTIPVVGHPRTVVSVENSEYGKVYTVAPDSPYITIIQTETDLIDTTVLFEGNVVDARTTNQNGTSGNAIPIRRIPGYGQPCNLPPALMTSTFGANYTLANCQAIP